MVDLPGLEIRMLFFTPLGYLEMHDVCQGLVENEGQNHILYPLDELARQVQARLCLSRSASKTTND